MVKYSHQIFRVTDFRVLVMEHASRTSPVVKAYGNMINLDSFFPSKLRSLLHFGAIAVVCIRIE